MRSITDGLRASNSMDMAHPGNKNGKDSGHDGDNRLESPHDVDDLEEIVVVKGNYGYNSIFEYLLIAESVYILSHNRGKFMIMATRQEITKKLAENKITYSTENDVLVEV